MFRCFDAFFTSVPLVIDIPAMIPRQYEFVTFLSLDSSGSDGLLHILLIFYLRHT